MSQWQAVNDNSKATFIRWFMSNWCNYKCSYCFYYTHSKNEKWIKFNPRIIKHPKSLLDYIRIMSRNSSHAFLNFSPKQWSDAFRRLSPSKVVLTMTGGEPFLDKDNMPEFLNELAAMDHISVIRIDTNGSVSLKAYENVDFSKVILNVSYHPEMIPLKAFVRHMEKKIRAGIKIGMVNYVMEPSQVNEFIAVKNEMDRLGIFTNCNVFVGQQEQTEKGKECYEQNIPPIDIKLKTEELSTRGQLCEYPGYAYEMDPTGMIKVGCFPNLKGDFIKGDLPERFDDAVKCPCKHCGCLDKYAFLKSVDRAKELNLLEEYVCICKSHRKTK